MHLLIKFWKNIVFNGDMLQVFGALCCFSSSPFLKQLASHVSANTFLLKFSGMKFFLVRPGNWNIFFKGLKFFVYFTSIANVVVLSILYVKHPNKDNNQQFNVKAILQKKKVSIHVKLGVSWYAYTNLIMQ